MSSFLLLKRYFEKSDDIWQGLTYPIFFFLQCRYRSQQERSWLWRGRGQIHSIQLHCACRSSRYVAETRYLWKSGFKCLQWWNVNTAPFSFAAAENWWREGECQRYTQYPTHPSRRLKCNNELDYRLFDDIPWPFDAHSRRTAHHFGHSIHSRLIHQPVIYYNAQLAIFLSGFF